MRKTLVNSLIEKADDPNFVFITGDLGFDALEPLAQKMGSRFINGGVAEQNIVSAAAGLAREGMNVWVYSIGPFLFSRAAEQIRNDVGLNNTSVCLVANGAGLMYGVQGPSHFSIDDLGFLNLVPNLETLTPAFDSDVELIVEKVFNGSGPTYVRLGRSPEQEWADDTSDFSYPRKVLPGDSGLLLCFGTTVSDYLGALREKPVERRPSVWVATRVPRILSDVTEELIQELATSTHSVVVEEHLNPGGFGMNLISLLHRDERLREVKLECLTLDASVLANYGSQDYLKQLSGLGLSSVLEKFGIGE